MSDELHIAHVTEGAFSDKKALLAALLLRDSPTADIRPSSSVNNKERVRFDCCTPGCEVRSLVCFLCLSFQVTVSICSVQRVSAVRKGRIMAYFCLQV